MADVPVELINFRETPLHVTDRPLTILGDDDVGWGFVKKITRSAKRGFKKATRPVRRIARTATWPARKAYKAVVPRKLRRGVNRFAKKAGRFVKKYGVYAVMPALGVLKLLKMAGMAIIKKYFGGAMKKITRRRARYMAYQRRGSSRPNRTEMMEAARWARKYAKNKGLWGKLMAAVTKKSKQMARNPRVRADVSRSVAAKRGRRVRMRGESDEISVVGEIISAATVTAMIPVIIALINAFLNRAAKQGAPTDPRQAAPEQNLMGEIAQGYTRQAMQGFSQPGGFEANVRGSFARYAQQKAGQQFGPLGQVAAGYLTQSFQQPRTRQPAMTFNYPEPEPQQFDFPEPQYVEF